MLDADLAVLYEVPTKAFYPLSPGLIVSTIILKFLPPDVYSDQPIFVSEKNPEQRN